MQLIKKFLCAAAIFTGVFSASLYAQQATVSGVVLDESTGKPLEFATVLLRDTAGHSLRGEITDKQGAFTLNTPSGELIFEASLMGYQAVQHKITVHDGRVSGMPEKIQLMPESREMAAVVVSATVRKPLIERKVDMLVMNVESMIAAESSNALELLKKAPGVSVDRDGNIKLNGQSVEIWLDGRPSQLGGDELVALLESTDGGSIDKVEIISHPSSKYDAAGSGGIINIKTKRNFAKGFNGNVRTSYRQYLEQDFFFGSNGGLSLSYRTEKMNTYLSYNLSREKLFSNTERTEIHTRDSLRRDAHIFTHDNRLNQSARLGFDYFLNKKNTLGFIANAGFSRGGDKDNGYTVSSYGNVRHDSLTTKSSTGREFNNGSVNLNYTHIFDNEAQELTANLDYVRFTSLPWQEQRTVYYTPYDTSTAFKNTNDQTVSIYSAKVDYAQPFGSKVKMESGAKLNQTVTDNANLRRDSAGGVFEINPNETSDFTYTERIAALYANLSWTIDTVWSVKGGLRYEYTYSNGDWRTADTITTKQLGALFPTLFVGYNVSKNHNLSFSYTRRIQRPGYWQFNPFKRYGGPYLYLIGNPDLDPAYTNSFSLSYSAFRFINASLGYSATKGSIEQNLRVVEGGKTEMSWENFGERTMTSFIVSVSQAPLAKWWALDANIRLSYVTNQSGNEPAVEIFTGNFWANNTFTLSKTLRAELSGWYGLPGRWGYLQSKSQWAMDFSVKKTLWNNNGSLSLVVNDIFKSNYFRGTLFSADGMRTEFNNTWSSSAVSLNFTYKFGNAAQNMRQRRVGEVEESSRVGG